MNELTTILSEPIARLGATTITLGHALAFGAILFLGLFVALVAA
ncbi:MAG: DNA recombination protein RmuC, partial [Mesorhizobium sp.]